MITTTEQAITEFWEKRGFGATPKYSSDGITCWDIDVPEDHEDLKDPEYISLCIQEKMAFPGIIRRRLSAPVYTIKSGQHYAMVNQPQFERSVPMSHSKQLLQFAFTNPATGMCPAIVPLQDTARVRDVLQRMKKSGAVEIGRAHV